LRIFQTWGDRRAGPAAHQAINVNFFMQNLDL